MASFDVVCDTAEYANALIQTSFLRAESESTSIIARNTAVNAFNCFVARELVTLPSGASLPMSEVKVGDRILSGNALGETSFSSVISVPHGANDLPATFLHLQLANGMDLKLTAEHRSIFWWEDPVMTLPSLSRLLLLCM